MKLSKLMSGLVDRAKESRFWLGVLNFFLNRLIPFNRPHGFCIDEIGDHHVRSSGPYKRANHNHVRGIHACGIATVAEISAGFLLLTKFEPQNYRLMMSRIEVDYLYQAKKQIFSLSSLSEKRIYEEILEPLQHQEAVSIMMQSKVCDISGNDIADARTTWQIKRWESVQTRV